MNFNDMWNADIEAFGLPMFDSGGNMLGNITSAQGAITKPVTFDTTLPNIGGSAALGTIPQAASAAGIQGAGTPPVATTGNVAATTGGSASDWFTRAVVVILGFIFVAVGLTQFKQNIIAM